MAGLLVEWRISTGQLERLSSTQRRMNNTCLLGSENAENRMQPKTLSTESLATSCLGRTRDFLVRATINAYKNVYSPSLCNSNYSDIRGSGWVVGRALKSFHPLEWRQFRWFQHSHIMKPCAEKVSKLNQGCGSLDQRQLRTICCRNQLLVFTRPPPTITKVFSFLIFPPKGTLKQQADCKYVSLFYSQYIYRFHSSSFFNSKSCPKRSKKQSPSSNLIQCVRGSRGIVRNTMWF